MLCVSFTNLCLSFIWIIGLGSVVDTDTDTDTWDHTDTDMSTQIKFWENDIIQCNHKCRCRVGVGHDTCRTPGHTFNKKCLCNIDYLSSDFKKLGSVSHTIGGRPCLVKISGNADYYFVTFLCTFNERSSIAPSIQNSLAFNEILFKQTANHLVHYECLSNTISTTNGNSQWRRV